MAKVKISDLLSDIYDMFDGPFGEELAKLLGRIDQFAQDAGGDVDNAEFDNELEAEIIRELSVVMGGLVGAVIMPLKKWKEMQK